jgi:hypothetical protein
MILSRSPPRTRRWIYGSGERTGGAERVLLVCGPGRVRSAADAAALRRAGGGACPARGATSAALSSTPAAPTAEPTRASVPKARRAGQDRLGDRAHPRAQRPYRAPICEARPRSLRHGQPHAARRLRAAGRVDQLRGCNSPEWVNRSAPVKPLFFAGAGEENPRCRLARCGGLRAAVASRPVAPRLGMAAARRPICRGGNGGAVGRASTGLFGCCAVRACRIRGARSCRAPRAARLELAGPSLCPLG